MKAWQLKVGKEKESIQDDENADPEHKSKKSKSRKAVRSRRR